MAAANGLKKAQKALRDAALAYPEAVEDFPWGHCAIKVKGKIFVSLAIFDDVLSMSVKLPFAGASALTLPFASATRYGLGQHGWITSKFAAGDEVPVELLASWIDESYQAIAPKKLVAQLTEKEDLPAPQRRKPRKK
jgi:predicted DNA-binding protein (MmcQ/YjbR family)